MQGVHNMEDVRLAEGHLALLRTLAVEMRSDRGKSGLVSLLQEYLFAHSLYIKGISPLEGNNLVIFILPVLRDEIYLVLE